MSDTAQRYAFHQAVEDLDRAGLDRAWLARLQDELADHFAELYAEERRRGGSHQEALRAADSTLGNRETLVAAAGDVYRPGWLDRALYAAGGLAVDSEPWRRWLAAMLLGSAATTTLLYLIQLAIFAGL